MSPSRRRLLQALAALPTSLLPAVGMSGNAPKAEAHYLSARKRGTAYEAAIINAQGQDRSVIGLPDRGHSFAIDLPRQRAVVLGRQPGFFAKAFSLDASRHQEEHVIEAASNRHFFGHGVFTPNGQCLLSTENDYEEGRAVIGIYDASPGGNFKRIGEWDCAGIGAHEAVLMPDGKTLCVANGGLLTHPDYDKTPLNLADMQPSLAYLDLANGELLEQVMLPQQWRQLSIRHLVVAASGDVWFGCQHMGPTTEQPPLVGRHRRGRQPELFTGQASTLPSLKNYIGSVSCDPSGSIIATSSPVGGRTIYWDANTGRELGQTLLADGCGVAPAPATTGRFVLTSGHGAMHNSQVETGLADQTTTANLVRTILPPDQALSWDNHMRRI